MKHNSWGTWRASGVGALGVLAAVTVAASTASADGATFQVVRAGHGISVDVGSKHVVGYFLANAKTCQVTLMMGDRVGEGELPQSTAARIRQSVLPNSAARVDTAEGESLELACHADGRGLDVRVKTDVASYVPLQ